ncbi:hypothetical protein ACEQ8H_007129 [Pleosporales sp. CAS-2024a]
MLLTMCLALLVSAGPVTGDVKVAATTPPESAGSRRRGVAFNDAGMVSHFAVKDGQMGWCYNWDSYSADTHTSFEYIPMLWGNGGGSTSKWWDAVNHAAGVIKDNPTHLLGFNEPDNCAPGAGGSCISVKDAVTAWKQHMEPAKALKDKMYLGSPAVTNGINGMGLDWLRSFISACQGCNIDFICIHWYDQATNVQYFKDHVNAARAVAAGRPIWITELGPQGSDYDIKNFLNEVIPWMDKSSDIHRYAYFMAREGLLINAQGTDMSDIGRHYTYWRTSGSGFTTAPYLT